MTKQEFMDLKVGQIISRRQWADNPNLVFVMIEGVLESDPDHYQLKAIILYGAATGDYWYPAVHLASRWEVVG